MRSISRNVRRSISGALLAALVVLAALAGCAAPQHGVAGRWQLSWHGRIGTEQAIVVLQQGGQAVSGSFDGARGSLPLSGSVARQPVVVHGGFSGSASLSNPVLRRRRRQIGSRARRSPKRVDGGAFAGHGGEVAPDYYRWSAVRIGRE